MPVKRFILIFLAVILTVCSVVAVTACNKEELTVTFMLSDSDVYTAVTVKEGSSLGGLPAQPKLTGHDFDGWYFDNGSWTQPFGGDTKVVENVSVYARWVVSKTPDAGNCRVIFDSRGGTLVSDIVLKSGETLTLPEAPERDGYIFSGWYTDLNFNPGEEFKGGVVNTNLTLYAYWLPVADEAYFTAVNGIITSISDAAKKLSVVNFPSELNGYAVNGVGDGLFEGNTSVTEINFPDGYAEIGEAAFKDCTSLKRVKFADSITSLGKSAFENCSSITRLQLPSNIETVSERCFYGCSSVTMINYGFNSAVTAIGDYAFYNLSKLTSIGIPDGVVSVGEGAYKNCSAATKITFGSDIETIGAEAFYGISKVTPITVPDSVKSMGDGAFRGCSSALSITIGSGISAIPDNAFRGGKCCESLTINGDIVSVGNSAFYGFEHLVSVTCPQASKPWANRLFTERAD